MKHGQRGRGIVVVSAVVALLATGCLFNRADDVTPVAVEARGRINHLLDQADAAAAGGDEDAAAQFRADANDEECLVFGCKPAVSTTTVAMDPTLAGGFFRAPWPSDTRRHADGTIDLTGFPGRSTIALADLVIGRGEAATKGFGNNSAVYFQATGTIDHTTVPLLAELSVRGRSNVLLLDLDHPTAAPVPVLVDVKDAGTALRPANLITVLPYPGHPLAPATRYGAALLDGLHDTTGKRLAPAPIIAALDGAAPGGVAAATWQQLRTDRDDVRAALRSRTLWHPSELVAFTAFTTQDPTHAMGELADAVAALPTPQVLSRTPFPSTCAPGTTAHTTGRLALPKWQAGTAPYINDGGGLVFDAQGHPEVQGLLMGSDGQGVLLDMAVPCGPAPANGWPILLWMTGTGGTARATPIAQLGPNVPYAVLSIAPLYSGDRLVPAAAPFNTSDYQFFNYLNPVAARTNLLQQAADVLYLERVAKAMSIDAAEAGGGVTHFDAAKVVMAGHSQGSGTLPLTLAYDPSVSGAFLSAAGGGLYHSIVHRADVRTLVDGLLGTGPSGELDIFHPYPQLLQTFAEEGDATNYASAVQNDLVLYAGLRDGCTSIEVATQLTEALGVPVANSLTRSPLFGPVLSAPYGSAFEPESGLAYPVSQNLPGGRTAVMVEVDSGHFGASNYPAIGRSFIDSLAATGTAVVDPGPTPPVAAGSSCPRFDPAPAAP